MKCDDKMCMYEAEAKDNRQLRININSLSQCVFPCHHFPGANVIRIFKVKRGREADGRKTTTLI